MKTCKSFLSVILAAIMLTGTALATDTTEKSSTTDAFLDAAAMVEDGMAANPVAVPLSEATGAVLSAAQEDLAEIRIQVAENYGTASLLRDEDIMIYDCGTQSVGDYEVSTTFYTLSENVPRASGESAGISVHTYKQSGIVRFKLNFMMYFSFDGVNASPSIGKASAWSNTSEATLTINGADYDLGDPAYYTWNYSVTYGTVTVSGKSATLKCSKQGIVSYEELSFVFPAE